MSSFYHSENRTCIYLTRSIFVSVKQDSGYKRILCASAGGMGANEGCPEHPADGVYLRHNRNWQQERVNELIHEFEQGKIQVFQGEYIGVDSEGKSDTYILKDVIAIE